MPHVSHAMPPVNLPAFHAPPLYRAAPADDDADGFTIVCGYPHTTHLLATHAAGYHAPMHIAYRTTFSSSRLVVYLFCLYYRCPTFIVATPTSPPSLPRPCRHTTRCPLPYPRFIAWRCYLGGYLRAGFLVGTCLQDSWDTFIVVFCFFFPTLYPIYAAQRQLAGQRKKTNSCGGEISSSSHLLHTHCTLHTHAHSPCTHLSHTHTPHTPHAATFLDDMPC